MVRPIFRVVRVLLGLIGAYWLLAGAAGIFVAGSDRAWGPAFGFALYALLGFCLAYSAFVRAPWERLVPELSTDR